MHSDMFNGSRTRPEKQLTHVVDALPRRAGASAIALTWNFPEVDSTAPSSTLYVDNALSPELLTNLAWKDVPAMTSAAVKQLASRV